MSIRRVQVAPQNGLVQRQSRIPHPSYELRTSQCVKYTMFFKNMIFLLCGVFVGAIGVIALQEKGKLHGKFDGVFLDPAAILLTAGVVTFVISFCGALGALRENKCLLGFFAASVILIVIIQLAIAIAVYFAKESIREKVDDVLKEAIKKYRDDSDLEALIDYMQRELKCCGSTQPNDWTENPYFNCTNTKILSRCSVPFSCCRRDSVNRMCGFGILDPTNDNIREERIYTTGCLAALENWFKDYIVYAAIVCGLLLVLQVIAVRLAFHLISDINEIIKWRDRH